MAHECGAAKSLMRLAAAAAAGVCRGVGRLIHATCIIVYCYVIGPEARPDKTDYVRDPCSALA